jgi:hypothetical protein
MAGAQDVGCADIAGADLAEVAKAGRLGEDQAEWDGAQEIAAGNGRQIETQDEGEDLAPII